MGNKEYKTPEEVKQRAEEAIGHSFKEIFELAQKFQQENGLKEKHGKGDIGQAYEEGWFNYACNEEAEPDFKDADIELKVTSFLINSRGYRAKERLSLGMSMKRVDFGQKIIICWLCITSISEV